MKNILLKYGNSEHLLNDFQIMDFLEDLVKNAPDDALYYLFENKTLTLDYRVLKLSHKRKSDPAFGEITLSFPRITPHIELKAEYPLNQGFHKLSCSRIEYRYDLSMSSVLLPHTRIQKPHKEKRNLFSLATNLIKQAAQKYKLIP